MRNTVSFNKKSLKKNKESVKAMVNEVDNLNKTFSDIFELAELETKKQSYDIIKIYSSEFINPRFKIELSVIKWNISNTFSLEKRKWFYNEKFGYWKMGRNVPIKLKDINIIEQNLHEIKSILS